MISFESVEEPQIFQTFPILLEILNNNFFNCSFEEFSIDDPHLAFFLSYNFGSSLRFV